MLLLYLQGISLRQMLSPGANVLKLFFILMDNFAKLVSLVVSLSMPFRDPCVMVASKAGAYHSRCSPLV